MLSYKSIHDNPDAFKVFTGLTKEGFETLCPDFASCWDLYVEKVFIESRTRKRKYGGGRKPKLCSTEDKLLFILFYYEMYPLQDVMAFLFNMSQGQANKWIHRLGQVLHMTLGESPCLPPRRPLSLGQVLTKCAAVEFRIARLECPGDRGA